MSALTIYLWTRLGSINCLLLILTMIYAASCAYHLIAMGVEEDSYRPDVEKCDKHKERARKIAPLSLLWAVLFALMPTQKDVALMYVIPSMANSETFAIIKKETPEIAQLALDALKGVLKDSVDNKKEHQKGE